MSREDSITAVMAETQRPMDEDGCASYLCEHWAVRVEAAITRALREERMRTVEAVGCEYDPICSLDADPCNRCRMLAEVQAELGDEVPG